MAKGRKRGGNPPRKRRHRTGGARSSSSAGSNRPRRSASAPRASGIPRPSDGDDPKKAPRSAGGSVKGRKPGGRARPTTGGRPSRSTRSKTTLRSTGGRPVKGRKGGGGRKPGGRAHPASSDRTNGGSRSAEQARSAADGPPPTAGSPPAPADGSRPASGSRQAARGTARRARTVTTQDGHPSRSGARRRSGIRRGRDRAARSASGSTAWGPGRPSGSRLRRAAASVPRRPRYWLRWLLVIGIILAVIGAVCYAMIASAAWVRSTIRSQDDAEAASQSRTDYPAPVACDNAQLRISLDAPKETSVGAGIGIDVTLTNEGGDACLLDVGGASLGAVIVSGDQTVWSSTSCPADPAERPLLIDAGESASASLWWNGASAAAGCSPSAPSPSQDPSLSPSQDSTPSQDPSSSPTPEGSASPGTDATASTPPVDPNVAGVGTYRLSLQLGGETVTGEQVFVIE